MLCNSYSGDLRMRILSGERSDRYIGIRPVNGIICSSTEQYSSWGSNRHMLHTAVIIGSIFQNLFVLSLGGSLAATAWMFCRNLKNRLTGIFSVMRSIRVADSSTYEFWEG